MYFASHWVYICVACLLLCAAGILKWRNRTSGCDPRKRRLVNYAFSASTPIQPGKTTYLNFAAPPSPWGDVRAEPTILRKFDGYAANGQSPPGVSNRDIRYTGHSDIGYWDSAASMSTESEPSACQDRPSAQRSRPAVPAASEFQSISPRLHPASFSWPEERSVSPPSVPASPISTPAHLRRLATPTQVAASALQPNEFTFPPAMHPRPTTRSNSISRSSSFTSTVPPLFESSIPPSATFYIRHVKACPYDKGRYKEGEKPVTAWFESESSTLIAVPPDLSAHSDLKLGDLFCHRTRSQCQIWIWAQEAGQPCRWKCIPFGYEREDGRRLIVTKKKRQPSWVSQIWSAKFLAALTREAKQQ